MVDGKSKEPPWDKQVRLLKKAAIEMRALDTLCQLGQMTERDAMKSMASVRATVELALQNADREMKK